MDIQILSSSQPLTENEIIDAEKRMGQRIPARYRDFLMQHNSGYPEPADFVVPNFGNGSELKTAVEWFLGINVGESVNLEKVLRRYRTRMPNTLFPIARDPGGSFICISTGTADTGVVYFWEHEEEGDAPSYDNVYLIAPDFADFISKLVNGR